MKYKKKKINPTSFKKGFTPWNKGLKNVQEAWNKGMSKEKYKEHYKNGFGGCVIANKNGKNHPLWGKHHSEETKNKIRETKIKQYKEHPEIWEKIGKKLRGKKRTKEICEKLSLLHIGEKHWNWKGGLKKAKCFNCKKDMLITNARLKRVKHVFCNRKCYGEYSSKNIIGERHHNYQGKLKDKKCITCKKIFKTRYVDKKFCNRKCYSKYQLGRNTGNKNNLWRGGISFDPYDLKWTEKFRRYIRNRDNQTCILCNIHKDKIKRALNVHHIDYNKKNSYKENCISLCTSCHTKTHFNRKEWIHFFQSILSKKYRYNYSKTNP